MRRFRSDAGRASGRLAALALLAFAVTLGPRSIDVVPTVVTTDIFIVAEDRPVDEDLYVASTSARVEGTIDGDLVITTGRLTITGEITGDVLALSSGRVLVEAGATVAGSVRTLAPQVVVEGSVGDDLLSTAASTTVTSSGSVARDVIVFGGTLDLSGTVGRDVRGRVLSASVDGIVGRDVDVAVDMLTIGPNAEIGGDLLYRSSRDASISTSAEIRGQVVELPSQSNFLFGVILTLANVVGTLAFLVAGIFILWLLRNTGARAVGIVIVHPVRSFFVGVAAMIAGPLLVLVLAFSLVGLPVAAVLLFGLLVALVFGPVPAVSALGDRLLRGRGGLFGAFLLGAVLWRLGVWLIPLVGGLLFLVGLVWGVGAWVMAGWQVRKAATNGSDLLPPAMRKQDDEIPDDWEYPLPPSREAP